MSVYELLAAFVLGGGCYVLIEILWRGRSHISMFLAGGGAFLLMHVLFVRYAPPLWLKLVTGMALITAIEFIFGYVVNLRQDKKVWDYRGMRCNLYGQVCLAFSLLWGLLTLPAAGLSALLHGFFAH